MIIPATKQACDHQLQGEPILAESMPIRVPSTATWATNEPGFGGGNSFAFQPDEQLMARLVTRYRSS